MARKAPLLMERAYGEIKRRIITLGLATGQRIDDHKLGREHALGRTPIREAVFRLAAEGLVEIRQNEGFFARSI